MSCLSCRSFRLSAMAIACGLIAACSPSSPDRSSLLGESYHAIEMYYLRHVTASRAGEASLAALAKLDRDVHVEANESGLVLERRARPVGSVAAPPADDWQAWGDAAARLAGAAAKASPRIGALAPATLDESLIDGAVAALDPYSRYLPPGTREDRLIEGRASEADAHAASLPGTAARSPSVTLGVDGGFAIVRISRFTGSTPALLRQKLERAFARSANVPRAIILDLRDDPGGQLAAAVEVADLFLDGGIIVTLEGRDPGDVRVFRAQRDGTIYESVPLAVLINGGSISSAELLAAALQGNGRAVVIGSASFGKGTAQRIVALANGGELWLTSAYMRTPAGYLLQHHGVIPDICTTPPEGGSPHARTRPPAPRLSRFPPERMGRGPLDEDWHRRLSCPSPADPLAGDRDLDLAKQVLADQNGWRP
jgi:hypothetical protein